MILSLCSVLSTSSQHLVSNPQDSKGVFHPSANALRIETMLEMELQKRLKLDVVEEKLLLSLMQYEKDRKMVSD